MTNKTTINAHANYADNGFVCQIGDCAKDARGFGLQIWANNNDPKSGQQRLNDHIADFHPRTARKLGLPILPLTANI